MKAIIVTQKGDIEHLNINEVPVPQPLPNQVLIKAKACGLNPVDWKGIVNGIFEMPYVMGSDVSGVVIETGAEVQQFKVGDEIIGSLNWAKQGAFAEYIATEEQYLVHKPSNLTFEEAAALPLATLTAWQGLFDKLSLQPKQKILIQAAAGGVGHLAVQLAKWHGAYVVAAASVHNTDFVKSLGADEVIDYKNNFEGVTPDFDAIFDSVASSAITISLLKKGGKYVSITAPANPELAAQYNVHAERFLFHSNQQQLQQIADLIESKNLVIHLDKVFDFQDVKQALVYQKEGRSRGKNVLKINQ